MSNPVTVEEKWEVTVSDERGTRKELRSRYVVADPGVNPVRKTLSELISRRRQSGKDGLSRNAMAACVGFADGFAKYERPTLDQCRAFAGQLQANRLSREEAEEVAGIAAYMERYAS